MTKTVEVFFATPSPYSYLGMPALWTICDAHGVTPVYRPMDLAGRVFAETGGIPVPKRHPARLAYRMIELKRWRDHLGMPMNVQPKHFPVDPALSSKMVVATRDGLGGAEQVDATRVGDFAYAFLRAVWAEERDIADPETCKAIALDEGLDGAALIEAAGTDDAKAAYDADTQRAIDNQVFGAPWFIYNGEHFWGQDRLDFLEQALEES